MKYLKKLSLLVLLPFGIIFVLYISSKRNTITSNFDRVFLNNSLLEEIYGINIEIADDMSFVAENLWINKRTGFLVYNTKGRLVKEINIKVVENNPIVNFSILNDTLYFYTGNSSKIQRILFKVETKDKVESKKLKDIIFDKPISNFILLTSNEFLIFELNGNNGDNIFNIGDSLGILKVKDYLNDSSIKSSVTFSGKMFNKDGYSVYSPFYRDDILILRESVKESFFLKPIDAINQQLEITRTGERISLSNDALTLRIGTGLYRGKYLFLSSFVRSKNQTEKEFKKNDIIDMYDIKTAKYVASFAIPRKKMGGIDDFSISNEGILAAKYNKTIIFYNLSKFIKLYLTNEEKSI